MWIVHKRNCIFIYVNNIGTLVDYDLDPTPMVPESINGQPAGTITGLAYPIQIIN